MRAGLIAAICIIAGGQLTVAQGAAGLLPEGVWHSAGLGYVAQADHQQVQVFDMSSAGCVRGPRYGLVEFRDTYGHAFRQPGNRIELRRGPTRDFMARRKRLPAACTEPLQGGDPELNLRVFTRTFGDFYPFFAQRNVDWEAAIKRTSAGPDLFASLSGLIEPLHDGHNTITGEGRSFHADLVVAPGRASDGTPWRWGSLRSSLRDYLQGPETPLARPAKLIGNNRVLYGTLGHRIGYLAILANGGWREGQTEDSPPLEHAAEAARVLDAILAEWIDLDAVVIDLRLNSGGFDAVSFEIASRFAKAKALAFTRQARQSAAPRYDVFVEPSARRRFLGRVAVLVGPNTVSAGESTAAALAALPNVALYGQPTRGTLSDAIPKNLPNGWTFTLSIETLRAPDGTLLEVNGVRPDVLLPSPTQPSAAAMWGDAIRAAFNDLAIQPDGER